HAGYAYSLGTAEKALAFLSGKRFGRVVILAPSHRAYLADEIVLPAAAGAETPLGRILFDSPAIQALCAHQGFRCSDKIHLEEHAAQIQYPLLQTALTNAFCVLPMIVGILSSRARKEFAEAIRPLLDKDTLLVVSSDFTHYGSDFEFAPYGADARKKVQELDGGAFQKIQAGDPQEFLEYLADTGATICGAHPIALMLELAAKQAHIQETAYANSSDLDHSNDDRRFVCYLSATGCVDWAKSRKAAAAAAAQDGDAEFLNHADKATLLEMARKAIEYVFRNRRACPATEFRDRAKGKLLEPLAVFVTLKERNSGALRGCIGELQAFRPLYQSVTARAVDAAFRDPRFPQLHLEELNQIDLEISVLTPPQAVDSAREIEIGRHGMTLTLNGRSAVFLPQVATEQGWDRDTTLTELARKAGLAPDAWKSSEAKFTVFEAIVFGEKEFRTEK
ncbi:MAG: AmmeMemoRadiSam system protein A, partial [Victivallaceae bacterium]|nr:AmmeMemoRadiSam system protein A [Victivallaceae bacterium]